MTSSMADELFSLLFRLFSSSTLLSAGSSVVGSLSRAFSCLVARSFSLGRQAERRSLPSPRGGTRRSDSASRPPLRPSTEPTSVSLVFYVNGGRRGDERGGGGGGARPGAETNTRDGWLTLFVLLFLLPSPHCALVSRSPSHALLRPTALIQFSGRLLNSHTLAPLFASRLSPVRARVSSPSISSQTCQHCLHYILPPSFSRGLTR